MAVVFRLRAPCKIQKVLAIGEKMRPAVGNFLPGGIECGHRCRRTTGCRDALDRDRGGSPFCKQDNSVVTPGASKNSWNAPSQRLSRTARDGDFFQTSVGMKRQKATISRPEGLSCSICSGKRLGCQGIESASPQLRLAGRICGNERQPAPVRRDGEEAWIRVEKLLSPAAR